MDFLPKPKQTSAIVLSHQKTSLHFNGFGGNGQMDILSFNLEEPPPCWGGCHPPKVGGHMPKYPWQDIEPQIVPDAVPSVCE